MGSNDGPKLRQQPSMIMYLAAISGLLGAIGMGLTIGWSSPAFDTMANPDSVPRLQNSTSDEDARTWIGSSMNIGALIGALCSGTVAQYFGRKKALIIYGIPYTIGWALLTAARSIPVLIAGRVFTGLATGFLSGTAPSYVVEIATINVRGLLGAGFQLFVAIGILLVYLLGAFLEWRPLSGVSMIPTLLMSICLFFMPESPSWLLSKGRAAEAYEALKRLRGVNNDSNQEMDLLKHEAESRKGQGFSWSLYKQRPHLHPFILSMSLMFYQQFCGVNAVLFFATSIFKDAGSSIDPKYSTIIIGVAQVIATLIGSLLMDRLGRKILLIASGTLHTISLAILGLYYLKLKDESSWGWLPLVCLVVFIIGFSIGFGPVPWLMVAEITPMESRSATSAMATAMVWTGSFFITKNFNALIDAIKQYGTFFMFSAICATSILFTIFALPETNGKSNEEIRRLFRSSKDDEEEASESNDGESI